MAADYDRLFHSPEGPGIPGESGAHTDFDIDSDFDVMSAAPPPRPTSPPPLNGQGPPPMPVDWTAPHPPARPEKPRPPMPVDGPQHSPPARPDTPRPPMPVDYDQLFTPTDCVEIPNAPDSDFDIDSGFDVTPAAPPPKPTSPTPAPNGHARPPMPVDRTAPHPPARPEKPRPPMPVGRPSGPDPARRETPQRPAMPVESGQRPPAPPNAPGCNRPDRPPVADAQRDRKPQARPRAAASKPAANGGPPPVAKPRPVVPQQVPAVPSTAAADPQPGAASQIGVKPTKKSSTKMISRRGWRRWVHKLTRINVGLSRDEKYDLDLRNRIRRSPRGSYQIAILGLKGGVGKTTVTVTLGSVFSQVRRDRILAFDADASCGNLADRAGRQSTSTIADLLADKDLTHYNDIRAHTSANAVNLEVLPAEDYSTARRAFSETDWHYAADAVSKFYNLVLADCGAGLFDPVTRGVLSTASAAVIVTNASIDGARQAAVAIDWMRIHGHQDLLTRACVVINNASPGEPNIAVAELVRQFEQYVPPGRVVVLPWDKHIAAGTEIQLSLLDPAYKRKVLELAAALSDDFVRSERR